MDGLILPPGAHGRALGIYVADCAAIYIVCPRTRALGLVHSGRKGSELGIAGKAISRMVDRYGCDPGELILQISPCIRPPHYEVDLAPMILRSSLAVGVPERNIHDCRSCTANDPGRYYSYRVEKGATGRMLAILGWGDSGGESG